MAKHFCGKLVIFLAILSWAADASRSILPKDEGEFWVPPQLPTGQKAEPNSEEILIPEFKGQKVKTACFSDCPPSTPTSSTKTMLFATTENGDILFPQVDDGGHYRWGPRLEGTKISIANQHENCVIDCFAAGDGTKKSFGTGSTKSEQILMPQRP